MTNEQAGPQGAFVGPEPNSTKLDSFQIQVTNAPYFGTPAYVGINANGWCFLTSDPGAAASFTGWLDGKGRKFIATSNGWLSYSGATPYYVGQWPTVSNDYQAYIHDGTLYLHKGVMCFFSDGSNTWLYNQSSGTAGYITCNVLPTNAP